MDLGELKDIIRRSFKKNRYTSIAYNGNVRNVYPYSFRDKGDGERLYAWCELHPDQIVESFYVDKIQGASMGDDIYYEPLVYSELSIMYDPESSDDEQ